jgi:predicted PurR-regulated permease PerM
VPRGIATPTIVLVVFGVLAAFVCAIVIAVIQFLVMLPTYSDQFTQVGEGVARWLGSVGIGQAQIQAIVAGIDPRNIVATVAGALGGVADLTGALVIVLNAVVQSIVQPRVVGQAVSLSQTVTLFSVLFWAVIIGPDRKAARTATEPAPPLKG